MVSGVKLTSELSVYMSLMFLLKISHSQACHFGKYFVSEKITLAHDKELIQRKIEIMEKLAYKIL